MSKLHPVSRKELIYKLKILGWEGPFPGGRHEIMQKGIKWIPIPNPHRGDIGVSLIMTILKEAGISRNEWLNA
jgi:predicted RNA binding protein YcfA (HicA-like mRNA interferase family)